MSRSWKKRRWLVLFVLVAVPLSGLVIRPAGSRASSEDLRRLLQATAPPPAAACGPALCLGGPEFMAALQQDLASARQRVLVQTLSFEGDLAGSTLVQALIDSPAPEKLLIIDAYSLFVQSDKFVGSPPRLLDFPLYGEACRMRDLVDTLRREGVQVRFGRPFGLGRDNLAARDHKKICVVDDVVYLGGINFSDHNFLWHDLMFRSEDPAAAASLAADFRSSWRGCSGDTTVQCASMELVIGSGAGRPTIARRLAAAIAGARHSIYLECPYITEPFFELLGRARRRGVRVTVVTSEHINRLGMKWNIMQGCADHDLDLRLMKGRMTHVKAMLVDDRRLVLGSANFDFLSGSLQPELLAVTEDPEVIGQFNARIKEPSLAGSRQWTAREQGHPLGAVGRGIMAVARKVLAGVHER